MKTALLHIGSTKTGTTSIQRALAQAKADGGLGEICYPLWDRVENQNRLAVIYYPVTEWSPWMRSQYPAHPPEVAHLRKRYRTFILNEMAAAPKAILSAEALSVFPPVYVAQLRGDLESLGYKDFHVVLYIRDPAEHYLSVTQQYLKDPTDPPLVEDPMLFRYPFAEMADTWEQVFPGRLLIRRFPTDPRHNVVDDFGEVLRHYMDVSLPSVDVRLNTTLSAEGMQILQDYRETFRPDTAAMTPDVRQIVRFLNQSVNEVPQTRPVLKPAVADVIRANHRADAAVIRSRYGVDLALCGHRLAVAPVIRQSYRVEDIVVSVDSQIVHQLLLRLANTELGRAPSKRSLSRRIASRAYWSIPPSLRPERLAAKLRASRNVANPGANPGL